VNTEDKNADVKTAAENLYVNTEDEELNAPFVQMQVKYVNTELRKTDVFCVVEIMYVNTTNEKIVVENAPKI
jgi:hypothetical protein